jgi:hypothetical protein
MGEGYTFLLPMMKEEGSLIYYHDDKNIETSRNFVSGSASKYNFQGKGNA